MAHLYKFTCRPNYPVISEATLIFVWGLDERPAKDIISSYADRLAKDNGFVYWDKESRLDYAGEIHSYMSKSPIICAISGEY